MLCGEKLGWVHSSARLDLVRIGCGDQNIALLLGREVGEVDQQHELVNAIFGKGVQVVFFTRAGGSEDVEWGRNLVGFAVHREGLVLHHLGDGSAKSGCSTVDFVKGEELSRGRGECWCAVAAPSLRGW